MADNTSNYGLPYPTASDGVVVHSDIERLARRVDTIVPTSVQSARNEAIQDADQKYGDLPERVTTAETELENMVPRDEAEQYGIEGPQGRPGNQGPRGLPGPGAVPADNAVASYLTAKDSQTRQAFNQVYGHRGQTYVRPTPPPTGVTYAWEGTPHDSPSVMLNEDGNVLARNIIPNPSFELEPISGGSSTTTSITNFDAAVASGQSGLRAQVVGAGTGGGQVNQWTVDVDPNDVGKWLGWSLVARQSSGSIRAARFYVSWSGANAAEYVAGWELTSDPNSEQPRQKIAVQIPEGATAARLWLRFSDSASSAVPPLDGAVHTDAWIAVIAETEQIALEQVSEYFDGDTPGSHQNDVWINPENKRTHIISPDTGQWEHGADLQADRDEIISGDWKFSRGVTGEGNRSRLAVEREYSTANGDLFDSTARLEFSMRGQQSTSQNPPGYSCASLSLFENGDNGAQYQGESARMLLISNRILFNRRLEVDMGGSGRANLRSGVEPGHQYAELGLHNASYPRWTIYGDQNESHSGNRKNVGVLDGARLEVRRSQPLAQSWIKTDNLNADQRVHMELADEGHMELSAEYNGQLIGGLRFDHDARTVELRATHGIVLNDHTTARHDLTFNPNRGPVIHSPNGTQYRVTVNNAGTLSTQEVS